MIPPDRLLNRAVPTLTARQAAAVDYVDQYRQLTGEAPPLRLVGKRLNVSRTAAFNLLTRAKARAERHDATR